MAEPKPSSEKPNLVAVPGEQKTGSKPESQAPPSAGNSQAARTSPTPTKASPSPAAPRERKGTRWVTWLLLLLLGVAAVTAFVQSQRLAGAEQRATALSEQVLGLEAQLSAANTQIHTFEMERGQVREAVSDIAERVLLLNELVGGPLVPAAVPQVQVESTP